MMNKTVFVSMFWLMFAIFLFPFTGEIVESFDTPGSCPTGLTFDGKNLWLADRKTDKLYCINMDNGNVIRSISAPAYWPMGLTWDGQALWNSDWKAGKIFQVDPDDGTILKTVDAPERSPRGLAWDGKYLWCADDGADKLIQLSPGDGTRIKEYKAPMKNAMGLCFDGRYLWNTDRVKDEIYMVDQNSGTVLLITDAPGPFTRGICSDGKYLWTLDYQNDKLYKLKVNDGEKFVRKEERTAKITQTHQVKNFGPGKISSLDVHLAIPRNRDSQDILNIRYESQPEDIITDKWAQETAHFEYKKIKSGKTVNSIMITKAKIYEIRYFLFPDKIGELADIPKEIKEKYLEDNEKYQYDHQLIKESVEKIVGDEQNCFWIARNIFDFLIDNMYYEMVGGWNTAPTVLARGNGSCSEYAFVYISMCRAAGLPARYVGSVVVRGDDSCMDNVFHRWVEVYFPGYGWVPVDPSGGDQTYPRDQANYFGHLANRFLITTQSGGGSQTMGWTYNSNEFWTTEPQTNVYIETIAEWEPE